MKKLGFIFALCLGFLVSCYDDSALVERIDVLEQSTIASLQTSISSLESQSAEIKASISLLEQSTNANATEISNLKESLSTIETKISELKTWIEELLEGYYTKEEIDTQIQALNTELETLRTSISSIESKLDILMREYVITFEDTEIGILAGGTTSVGYAITGATEKTTVKALGQNGWSAKVTPDGIDKGKITVTAPNPMTDDEIIVLVYDGEYRTIMSSINFVTGVVTPSQTAVELKAEAGTIDISVTSNLNYKVSIPEDANDWLSVVDTRATKTETITFAYTANEFSVRHTEISFTDDSGNFFSKISFIQQGSVTEVTLTEAGTLLTTIGENVYQSIKSLKINGLINGDDIYILRRMQNLDFLDMENVNFVHGGRKYYDTTLADCTTKPGIITPYMFFISPIKKIILPKNIEEIQNSAFLRANNLEEIIIPDSVTEIGLNAFSQCISLREVKLSENLEKITIGAFSECFKLTKITLPDKLQYLDKYSFTDTPLEEIHIKAFPSTLTYIGDNAFDNDNEIYNNAKLYIPKGTKDAYFLTDLGRFKNIIEE